MIINCKELIGVNRFIKIEHTEECFKSIVELFGYIKSFRDEKETKYYVGDTLLEKGMYITNKSVGEKTFSISYDVKYLILTEEEFKERYGEIK